MRKLRERVLARCLRHMQTHLNSSGKIGPDFIVGKEDDPYLKRWFIVPKNPLFAIYLHEFCKDDDDVPHDHPYLFNLSWILQVGYFEHQFSLLARRLARRGFVPDYRDDLECRWRPEGVIIARWGWTAHRVQLRVLRIRVMSKGEQAFVLSNQAPTSGEQVVERRPRPITLFFCGPRVREWGFYCTHGWRHWREYIAPTSYGNRVGKGCGE